MSQLPEALFPGAVPATTVEAATAPSQDLGAPGEPAAAAPEPGVVRWSGRTTALVAAGVLALSGVGAVAAAAATPNGISAPDSGVAGRGGPGGPGGPGQGQFPGRGQLPDQGQHPGPGRAPVAPNR